MPINARTPRISAILSVLALYYGFDFVILLYSAVKAIKAICLARFTLRVIAR